MGSILLIFTLHTNLAAHLATVYLESRFPPLIDPGKAAPYDAIVVLTADSIPATGLVPFPGISRQMFRRLEETYRLYQLAPKPIIVAGGDWVPFAPPRGDNKIAHAYLVRWGVAPEHLIAEMRSRDTFESAQEVNKILQRNGWHRYLLVTSALHIARSMLAFHALAPQPVAAPGDFTAIAFRLRPVSFFPSESAAEAFYLALHESLGLLNYRWRLYFFSGR